tara:strand:- start:65 stop:667 length:603 start_codon:yes stop_codon:yes gene_type:complete
MKILVACEYSGTVRDAFAELGHDAWSCDTLPTESKGNHIQDDVLKHLDKDWDLLIAHPPCTYLSRAGARWLYPKAKQLDQTRYEKGLKGKEFFMKLLDSSIDKIAIENPTPFRIFNLPKPTQVIQPYEFGHNFSKRTLLWLKNLTQLKPTDIVDNYKPLLPSNTGGKKRGQKSSSGFVHNAKDASKTFIGIAKAMAEQWG